MPYYVIDDRHYSLLRNCSKKAKTAFLNIESKIPFRNLRKIVEICYELVCEVEKDKASLGDGFAAVFTACKKLDHEQYELADILSKQLVHRFTTTATLKLPLFAYLLTNHGIYDYFNADLEFRINLFQTATRGMLDYLHDLHLDCQENIQQCIEGFHQFVQLSTVISPNILIWQPSSSSLHHEFPFFMEIVKRVSSMPCSEAAVERLFSRLTHVFNTTRAHANDKTLNARLTIKMNYLLNQPVRKPKHFPSAISIYSHLFDHAADYLPLEYYASNR